MKFVIERCKLVLYLVLKPRISWIVVYKSLFFTTNNNKENIYCEYKGKISNFFKQLSTRVSVSGLSNDLIYSFLNLKNIITVWWMPLKNYTIGYLLFCAMKIPADAIPDFKNIIWNACMYFVGNINSRNFFTCFILQQSWQLECRNVWYY